LRSTVASQWPTGPLGGCGRVGAGGGGSLLCMMLKGHWQQTTINHNP
jgi:hypothetical protein